MLSIGCASHGSCKLLTRTCRWCPNGRRAMSAPTKGPNCLPRGTKPRWAVDHRRQLVNQAESLLCQLPEQARAGLTDQPEVRARLGALVKRTARPPRTRPRPCVCSCWTAMSRPSPRSTPKSRSRRRTCGSRATKRPTFGGALRRGPALGGRTTGRGRPPPLCWRRPLRPLQRHCAIARIICRGRRRAGLPPPRLRREPAGEGRNLPRLAVTQTPVTHVAIISHSR